MIVGSVYGVVLNDREQNAGMMDAFGQKPYAAPPKAPVLYIKPHNTLRLDGAAVPVPGELPEVEAAATIALLFGDQLGVPVAAALALDVCEPHASYYRPAIRQRCRDGFLPMGSFVAYDLVALTKSEILTLIDGVQVHRWSLERLVRAIPDLIADVTAFMTLADGDVLLIGLAGDAPRARVGQRIEVRHAALPRLVTSFEQEVLA